ncbi:MAG TPA: hypothetical protein VIZ65_00265 [Cellvibrionaceae bacterium]
MTLSTQQLTTLRQCAEEQCSVIELLQELHTAGSTLSDTRALLVAELKALASKQQMTFFLDDFAAASTRSINAADAILRLEDDATWDMHSLTQLHVSWYEP